MVSPSLSCSTIFYFPVKVQVLIPLFTFFKFSLWSARTAKFTIQQVLFFCWLPLGLVVWPRLGDLSVSPNVREVYASLFPAQILGCAYTMDNMIKFQFLAQFPVDHFAHPFMSSFTLFCANLLYIIILLL